MGESPELFRVSKEGVLESQRWITNNNTGTIIDELTNYRYKTNTETLETGTVEFVRDVSNRNYLKNGPYHYASYPNINKLATRVLDKLDNLNWDNALLSKLEADLAHTKYGPEIKELKP